MGSQMEKHLFNLKFAAKDLERNAKKSEKAEKEEQAKCKRAMTKNNPDGARIHAENAIRNKTQALNYRRMSARIDAVSARVQTAITTRQVTKSMAGVCNAMEGAMRSMNLEKVQGLMDKFEKEFENLDVQSQVMEGAMANSSTLATPQNEVDGLMRKIADESGIEVNLSLPASGVGQPTASATANPGQEEQDELTERLAKLRQL